MSCTRRRRSKISKDTKRRKRGIYNRYAYIYTHKASFTVIPPADFSIGTHDQISSVSKSFLLSPKFEGFPSASSPDSTVGSTVGSSDDSLVIYFDRIYTPKSIHKSQRVVSDVLLARFGQGGAFGVGVPDISIASPVTAKGSVKDKLVVLEVVVNAATVGRVELGQRSAPSAGIGVLGTDIRGNSGSGEEPDGNVVGCPLSSVDAAVDGIESISIILIVRGSLTASIVALAVAADQFSTRVGPIVANREASRSVQSNRIRRLGVDAFDDVYLARAWPVGANHPEGGPGSADAAWHVTNISDEEAVVERLLRCHAD